MADKVCGYTKQVIRQIWRGFESRVTLHASRFLHPSKKIDYFAVEFGTIVKWKNISTYTEYATSGQYAYQRKDGVLVVPVGCLKP